MKEEAEAVIGMLKERERPKKVDNWVCKVSGVLWDERVCRRCERSSSVEVDPK